MYTTHPYIPLTSRISPAVVQGYIALMVFAVVLGTVFDLLYGQ